MMLRERGGGGGGGGVTWRCHDDVTCERKNFLNSPLSVGGSVR